MFVACLIVNGAGYLTLAAALQALAEHHVALVDGRSSSAQILKRRNLQVTRLLVVAFGLNIERGGNVWILIRHKTVDVETVVHLHADDQLFVAAGQVVHHTRNEHWGCRGR